mgnify:CR=1 FL=1
MKTMIFAAGLGTRLKPLTDNLPKALAPVAGHTLLYYVLMRLRAAGSDEFVINIHHFADKIREYVAADPELSRLDIRYSDETDLLRDTGGGIRYAESLLRSAEGRFLVHNVDIISDLQLDWFRSQTRPGALATLLLSERVTKRYFLCDGDNRIVGWTNVATGEVKTPFPGLDVSRCHKAAFAGVHLVSDAIFDVFRDIDSSPSDYPLYDAGCFLLAGMNTQDIVMLVSYPIMFIPAMIYASLRSKRNSMFDSGCSIDSDAHFGKGGFALCGLLVIIATIALSLHQIRQHING